MLFPSAPEALKPLVQLRRMPCGDSMLARAPAATWLCEWSRVVLDPHQPDSVGAAKPRDRPGLLHSSPDQQLPQGPAWPPCQAAATLSYELALHLTQSTQT